MSRCSCWVVHAGSQFKGSSSLGSQRKKKEGRDQRDREHLTAVADGEANGGIFEEVFVSSPLFLRFACHISSSLATRRV